MLSLAIKLYAVCRHPQANIDPGKESKTDEGVKKITILQGLLIINVNCVLAKIGTV